MAVTSNGGSGTTVRTAIEAQLQAELLQQQVEELDVAYIMFMLAAHA